VLFRSGRYSYLQKVEAVPLYPGIREPQPDAPPPAEDAESFFARMTRRRFDLAIQMHGGGSDSNPFVARLGARHTLGLRAAGTMALEMNLSYQYYQHEIIRYLELVGLAGVAWDGLEMDLPVLTADRERLLSTWPERPERYAVVHCGAGDVRRRWPLECWARVVEHIHTRHRLPVALTGGANEQPAAARLQTLCKAPTTNLAGRLDLGALAALLQDARLMVANDTGPAHMACALGIPSVVVYWCGNLINAGPMRRERFRPVLSWTIECPICHTRERCACPASWVAEAPLEEVIAQVDNLLTGDCGLGIGPTPEAGGRRSPLVRD
jgi:ADP-heptose:LPS heptosyltransferase